MKSAFLKDFGEKKLIRRIKQSVKCNQSVLKGIGDDTAVLKLNRTHYLLYTSDMLLEGLHFRRKDNPRDIGHKALACSLSDIASMGGLPCYGLISLGLPRRLKVNYLDRIYEGILSLASEFSVKIVGGDIIRSNKIIIDICLIGQVEKKNLILRSNAKAGDIIFVTGRLGGSLKSKKHLRFTPRIKQARYLVKNHRINSMIDISDGLASDLWEIAKQSKKGAVIYESALPFSDYAASLDNCLYDGEDFELLFTLSAKEARRLIRKKGSFFYPIGEITGRKFEITIYDREGKSRKLDLKGFKHF